MSNAIEFISAYNEIDARLRELYKGKGNPQFSDLVRRCADFNPTVRRFEDELLAYARLRNAIVHNSTKERIIAEPCDDATREICSIARLLSRPPQLKRLKRKALVGIGADKPLSDAVVRIAESGFSNLPVYRGERIVGMLNNRRIVRELGKAVKSGRGADAFLKTPCGEMLSDEDLFRYYKVLSEDDAVQEAIDAFSANRKLNAVIVTDGKGAICNLLTSADIPQLLKLLEE